MAQSPPTARCVVCDARAGSRRGPAPAKTGRVTIRGRTLILCRTHAGQVAIRMPKTWDELCALFSTADERRSPIARRGADADDRRVFPPRPEGRRRDSGRRAGDPRG